MTDRAERRAPQPSRQRVGRQFQQANSADSAVTSLSRPEAWMIPYQDQQINPPAQKRIDSFALQRETIQQALHLMASYLASQGQNITIITVGGSISGLLLKDQLTRKNLDYLATDVSEEQRKILAAAAKYARLKCSQPIRGAWFSTRGDDTLKLPFSVHKRVVLRSISQNEIIFQAHGLKILAAPWDYAFVATLGRLASDRSLARPHDLADAIAYLHRYIEGWWDGPLTMSQVEFWARSYGIRGVETMARFIATRYRAVYGRDGIVDSPPTGSAHVPLRMQMAPIVYT
ncbi:hypothetical protein EPUS_05906 [Endocarpon pusillum Z07020]|uniref:DUF7582 domain-containing protein n=1 Tax=Endocarpon pusillum (strain Z07020 / HMAS-L-300199) TaxID=1263415 RepID=U1HWV0_ENDPU|nr:uncharacterized protein EPUS_05906 [Endocarpon pusillum Z07020]ERF73894.1 hypothetical protein EPUS_05906 [Endocarpon pusillum Z07020]